MAIVQISKILHRSGNIQNLPQLDSGEIGIAVDLTTPGKPQNRIFIGPVVPVYTNSSPSSNNIEVLSQFSSVSAITVVEANAANANVYYPVFGNAVSGSLGLWANANLRFDVPAGRLYTTFLQTTDDAIIGNNLTVGSNLVVNGNLTYLNTESLVIEDPLIQQGTGPNGTPLPVSDIKDRGAVYHFYNNGVTDTLRFNGWDTSADEFAFGSDVTLNANETVTFNAYGNMRFANANIHGNIDVNGGTIRSNQTTFNLANSVVTTLNVGGAATTINMGAAGGGGIATIRNDVVTIQGIINISNTTDSTSTTTGSMVTAGGIGVAKTITVGGNANITGNILTTSTTAATSTTTGALQIAGGAGIVGNVYVGGNANVTGIINTISTTAATSTTTGALQVAGGAGIVGNTYIGGNANVTGIINTISTTAATSTTTGALQVAGGAGIVGNVYVGGNVDVTGNANVTGIINTISTTAATSTTTGALQVAGGAGIVGNVHIGGNANVTGVTNSSNTDAATSTTTGALILAGGAGIAGNVHIGGNANVTGNVNTAAQLISTIATGTAPLIVTSTTRIANMYVTGANEANIQLQSTGNFYLNFTDATSGNKLLNANVAFIANCDNGQLFAAQFVGNFAAPGSNQQVIFNDSGNLGAHTNFVYDKATGNAAIGHAAPASRLDVRQASNDIIVKAQTAGTGAWLLLESDVGYNSGVIHKGQGGAVHWTSGMSQNDASYSIAKSAFGTTDRFINVDVNGNLGVKTTTPGVPLHVVGDAQFVSGSDLTYISSTGAIELVNSGGSAYIDFKTSAAEDHDCRIIQVSNGLQFVTGGDGTTATKMTITSGIGVGVNTTSPDANLTVNGTANVWDVLTVKRAGITPLDLRPVDDASVYWRITTGSIGTTGGHLEIQNNGTGPGGGGTNALVADYTTNRITMGNVTVTNNTNLGAVTNVNITGGTNGDFLQTDGAGTLSWATLSANAISGSGRGMWTANGGISGGWSLNAGASLTGTNAQFVITGGTNGDFLQTDGAGTLSWATLSANAISGSGRGMWTANGAIGGAWTLNAGASLQATYADLAEYYVADAHYECGVVLEFGGTHEVTVASDETTRVAGVVTTNPAYTLNAGVSAEHVVAIALVGRTPCKVRGNIRKGDMLCSGGDGYARPTNNPKIGTIIGKALENFSGEGVIEIAVHRH